MTARAKTAFLKAPLVSALTVLVTLLAAWPLAAYYPPIGDKPTGNPADPYMNPNDGMCVVGLALDGTMLVDWSVDNARDCEAYTNGLESMTTQAACINAGGAGNDGYRHQWATSNTCVNSANPAVAISLKDLDRTDQMCQSKGGTGLSSPGTCKAYGWIYRNRLFDGPPPTLPITGSGIGTTHGVPAADGLGFCYTTMNMTSTNYNSSSTCPSYHNVSDNGGAKIEWPDCGSSTTGCQTQASYDAGLGWSFSGGQCRYNYGVKGITTGALTKPDGTPVPAGTVVDLTAYTYQGDCLANGGSWDNWLPSTGSTTVTQATNTDLPDLNASCTAAGTPLPCCSGPGAGACETTLVKLDALTPVEGGGGEFYTGTGFNCLRCHSDQSRRYQERDKPGFVKSRHLKAGDDASKPFYGYFTPGSSSWGLHGVECTMCHSTAKPAQDDLIQVVPKGAAGEGNPKSATGHNQTEYGAHLLDVCYTCHGTPASPPTINPAALIPVSGGDFALTANTPGPATSLLFSNYTGGLSPFAPPNVGGLAPIMNQFLNSPHAEYGISGAPSPTSAKIDIGDKTNYGSSFEGYVCRTSNGIGSGSIITTVYRNGVAEKIPNLDSDTNPACTNPPDGSPTSGAGGYWVRDGETSPGTPALTDQGNCMTCHDVHWALADTNPEAEPFRRECTTCHMHQDGSPSITGAPQIDLALINHSKAANTPLENWLTDPDEACETCHMPDSSPTGSHMHLWRINTDPNYQTMTVPYAATAPDGDYTNAVWVDIPHACGQCHGTDGITSAKPGIVPPYSTAQLAVVAQGMHSSSGISYQVTFSISTNGLDVTTTPIVECGGDCPALTYDWDWGDGAPHTSDNPGTHTYASGGTKSIKLTVFLNGGSVGSATQSFTINATATPLSLGSDSINDDCTDVGTPYECCTGVGAGYCATCTWDEDTWTMSLSASATGGTPPLQFAIRWGDTSSATIIPGDSISTSHTYRATGGSPYTVTEMVIDSKLKKDVRECAVQASPTRYQITGTVLKSPDNTPVANAYVRLKYGTNIVKSVYTAADGTFALTGLRPANYMLKVAKTGFTFPAPTWVMVGPDQALGDIYGTKP